MKFEAMESEAPELEPSGFQNSIFADNPMHQDLMPGIRFTTDAAGEKVFEGFPKFQNDIFDVQVTRLETVGSGDYVGPSTASLDIKIDKAIKDLTFAQEQLEKAIENGTGVITAMNLVESAQKLLDTYIRQHAEAAAGEAKQFADAAVGKAGTDEVRLGSVSHAQWKLEQAYLNGNSIAIENAKRELAREKAKEEAKK